MSIKLRGSIYWIYLRHGGRQVRRSTGTSDTKAAQELHDQIKAELWRTEKLGDKPQVSWDKAALSWWEEHAQHKKSASDDRHKIRWLTTHLKSKRIVDIDAATIQAIRQAKTDEGASKATVNRHMATLSAVLHHAHGKGWIDGLPKIPMHTEQNSRIRWITQEEALRLLEELPPHLAAMARFTLATGLRRANVTGLTWQQVDLQRAVAWIHADEMKARKALGIPLNDDARAVLIAQRGQHPTHVFHYQGAPVIRTGTKAWEKACARAGIADFHWHDLRHTWASWHVMAGTPLHELKELGGWRSLDMVLRYAHLAPDHLAKSASNIRLDCAQNVHALPLKRA